MNERYYKSVSKPIRKVNEGVGGTISKNVNEKDKKTSIFDNYDILTYNCQNCKSKMTFT